MFSWLSWENPVAIWWVSLILGSTINILFWLWTRLFRFKNVGFSSIFRLNNQSIIWFSFLYVTVCAFRSFLPRADVQRIVLFDSWWSSVFVGRSVATIAELAFVVQWYLVLNRLTQMTNEKSLNRWVKLLVPMIFFAEVCSWYAVISTHYLGNSIEESTWALTYCLIGIVIFKLRPHFVGAMKMAMTYGVLGSVLYVTFMFSVDVPMYVGRLLDDMRGGKTYLSFWQGLADLNTRWIVTYDINDWKTEIPWQSLYFTFAVLVSIALCYVPLDKIAMQKFLKNEAR